MIFIFSIQEYIKLFFLKTYFIAFLLTSL